MRSERIRRFGTALLAANALIAFLSLTNLFLIAAGAIQVEVPGAEDLHYEYDRANRTLSVDSQFTVRNKGIYSVSNLDIEARLSTHTGYELLRFTREDLRVSAGEERSFPIDVDLDLSRLVDREMLSFLVEDGAFQLTVKVRADYTMGLTKFRSDERMEYPWTAPLHMLRDLLVNGSLLDAVERVLDWAGPIVRERLSTALVDAAMAEGEWRHDDLGGWADLDYRLLLDQEAGTGSLDANLSGQVAGFEWGVGGSVPLVIVDGLVYLESEVMPDG